MFENANIVIVFEKRGLIICVRSNFMKIVPIIRAIKSFNQTNLSRLPRSKIVRGEMGSLFHRDQISQINQIN